jgi:dynein heavy chain, axonemal
MQLLLQENRRIRARVPASLQPLMILHLEKIDQVLEPGLTTLNWTSVKLTTFVDDVYRQFQAFELLIDRVTDLIEFRINAMLNDISSTTLCELPSNEPWTIDQFLDATMVCIFTLCRVR